jgi:hypothetical protein
MATSYGNRSIITDSLVYSIDTVNPQSYPGSGAIVYNTVGVSQGSSTFQNSSNNSSAPTSDAISWDFAGSKHIRVLPADLFETGTDDMSWSCWFKSDENPTDALGSYLYSTTDTTMSNWQRLYILTTGVLKWNTDDGLNPLSTITGETDVCDGEWHNAVVSTSWDGSNHTQKMYLDGAQEGSTDTNVNASINDNGAIWIGGLRPSGNINNTVRVPWIGSLGNFSVYRKELSLSEIQQNYNALKSRFE